MASVRRNNPSFQKVDTPSSIKQWLARYGLEAYETLFHENEIDIDVATSITEADLLEMGLSIGVRRKLALAIAELGGNLLTERSYVTEPYPFERRYLTVLFCDLVGSTEMSQQMDPEALQVLYEGFLSTTQKHLEAFGGYTQQYQGDGVLACFGWPVAYEDQVARSIRAGLAISKACNALNKPNGETLSVRIGVATGLTLVGEMADQCARLSNVMAGLTPNLAARLQELAAPNHFLIDATTKAEIDGQFDVECLGFHNLKGLSAAVPAWRVVGESRGTVGKQEDGTDGTVPLIGRSAECGSIVSAWREVCKGHGQAVVVFGEAGIGKTRLVREFQDLIKGEQHSTIRISGFHDHIHSSLFPIAALFRTDEQYNPLGSGSSSSYSQRLFGLTSDPSIEAIHAKISAIFDTVKPISNRRDTPPDERLMNLTTLFIDYVKGISARGSLLIIIEDIQWIDDTTLKLFEDLRTKISTLPILLLVTSRPPHDAIFRREDAISQVELTGLQPRDNAALVRCFDARSQLTEIEIDAIVNRSEGSPLFAKELTRSTIEAKREIARDAIAPFDVVNVPISLRSSLMSRIDRLGSAKRFVQVCAAIGRTFTLDLVRAIMIGEDCDIDDMLNQSVDAGLIRRHIETPSATYMFTHALLQEVTYETLLIRHRQDLHRRIASALLSKSQAFAEQHPEVVAHHFERADIVDKAIEYYFQASVKSASRNAHFEASSSSRRALDLLARTGETSSARALDLWVMHGQSSFAIIGYGASQTLAAFEMCRALMQETGSSKNAAVVARGLVACLFNRAELDRALEIAEDYMNRTLASEALTRDDLYNAHRVVVGTYNALGRFQDAGRHGRIALAALSEEKDKVSAPDLMSTRLVNTNAQLAISTWHEGNAIEADRLSRAVVEQGKSSSSVHNRFIAMVYGGCIPQLLLGNRELLRSCAMEVVLMSGGHRAPSFRAVGQGFLGGAHVRYGEIDLGRAALQTAFRLADEQEQYIFKPVYHLFLAEADLADELWDQAISTCDQGLSISKQTKEMWFDVLLQVLKAEALQRGGWPTKHIIRQLDRAEIQAEEQQSRGLGQIVSRAKKRILSPTGLGDRKV